MGGQLIGFSILKEPLFKRNSLLMLIRVKLLSWWKIFGSVHVQLLRLVVFIVMATA